MGFILLSIVVSDYFFPIFIRIDECLVTIEFSFVHYLIKRVSRALIQLILLFFK